MTENVRQAFLNYPKKRSFLLGRKARKATRTLDLDLNSTPLPKTIRIPLESRGKPELIEQGRMQHVGERADFVLDLAHESDRIDNRPLDVDTRFVQTFCDLVERHHNHRQFLAGNVVEVAGDTAALLVL